MKSKAYFMRQAVLRTIITGVFYLLMPVWASLYDKFIPDGYEIYQFIGAVILLIGNILLLVQAWALALDKDVRYNYNNNY